MPSKKFCETGILDYENGERCPSRYDALGREIVDDIPDKKLEEPTSLQKTIKN